MRATCAKARLANEWCAACGVGYVAGVPIRGRLLFECIDAHGHQLVPAAIECASCQDAMKRDAFCETCRIGWLGGLAYFSRLTYRLAQGEARDRDDIRCDVCRANAARTGWCAACGVGMIGNTALRDRAAFDDGCRGFELMLTAIDALPRCDICALSIMTDTQCFRCKKQYKDGKVVTP